MPMSLLLLYCFYHFIPYNWDRPVPHIGMPFLRALSQARTYRYFQWMRPPNVIVGGGNNSTVCVSYIGQWRPD